MRYTKSMKSFSVLLSGLIVLAFSSAVFADDDSCSEIRLDAPEGPMERVPVTFQGHVGICYGHAAAQMVDAFRFSHPWPEGDSNYDHLTSSLEVAVGVTNASKPTDDFTDGAFTVCPSVHYSASHGSCDEGWVRQLYSAQGIQRSDFTERFRQLQSDFQDFRKKAPAGTSWTSLVEGFRQQSMAAEQDFVRFASPEARKVLPDAETFLKMVDRGSHTEAMDRFLEPFCENKPRQAVSAHLNCHESKPMQGKAIFTRIHTLLRIKNAQPIAIKMCRNIFEQGHTYAGVNANGFKKDCQLHWPLIIGQKRFGGTCRFLVRNSMGTGDTGYSNDWLPREHGNLWIDEDTLAANTLQMAYIGE